MKPFDLEKALAGHPLSTRDGRKVLDFHYFKDAYQDYKIYGLVENADKSNFLESYSIDGKCNGSEDNPRDLFLVTTKKTYWVNVYRDGERINTGLAYESEEEAKINANYPLILKTISFTVEE